MQDIWACREGRDRRVEKMPMRSSLVLFLTRSFWVIKLRSMRLAMHVAHRILIGKPERKILVGRCRFRRVDNIKNGSSRTRMAGYGLDKNYSGYCEHGNESFGFCNVQGSF
jgi:hypothetical protein